MLEPQPLAEPVPAPAAAAQPVRKPALPALTGLRTLLAINIMFFHFTPPHPNFLSPLLNNAYVFVGFFFLISGFVLAYNYADRPVLSRRKFYLARISRVYPVYVLVLILSIPFLVIAERAAHTPATFWTGVILTPLTLQSWSPPLATFWNTVAWTVPAEMFLYLIFPFILLLIARIAPVHRNPRPAHRSHPHHLDRRPHPPHDLSPPQPRPPPRTRRPLHVCLLAAHPQVQPPALSLHLHRRNPPRAPSRQPDS